MTLPARAEFEEREKEYLRSVTPIGAVMFVAVLAAAYWWEFAESSEQSLTVMGAIVVVAGVSFWHQFIYMPRRFGLECPSCDRSIVRARRSSHYTDKGLCPWCKERVWRDS
jgi:hypothetical protein